MVQRWVPYAMLFHKVKSSACAYFSAEMDGCIHSAVMRWNGWLLFRYLLLDLAMIGPCGRLCCFWRYIWRLNEGNMGSSFLMTFYFHVISGTHLYFYINICTFNMVFSCFLITNLLRPRSRSAATWDKWNGTKSPSSCGTRWGKVIKASPWKWRVPAEWPTCLLDEPNSVVNFEHLETEKSLKLNGLFWVHFWQPKKISLSLFWDAWTLCTHVQRLDPTICLLLIGLAWHATSSTEFSSCANSRVCQWTYLLSFVSFVYLSSCANFQRLPHHWSTYAAPCFLLVGVMQHYRSVWEGTTLWQSMQFHFPSIRRLD